MASLEFKGSDILRGHTSKETAYLVPDYPYGYSFRTSIRYWIESKKFFGDRLCSVTINPSTQGENKPKLGTYSPFKVMYLDGDGHVQIETLSASPLDQFPEKFRVLVKMLGSEHINDIQVYNLRSEYANSIAANAMSQRHRYSPGLQPKFNQWLTETIKHIEEAPIAEMVDHSAAPEPDIAE